MTVSECSTEQTSSVASADVVGDKASRVRVFLAEGDPQTRTALAALLAKRGFDVQSADEYPALHRSPSHVRGGRPPEEQIVCGKLTIDQSQRRARWDGVEVPLTVGEFGIVVRLASNAGSCVDKRTVYDCLRYKGFVSGQGEKGFWVNVRSAIRRIRKKFRAVDSGFDDLETVQAFGYCWRKPY